MTEHSQTLLRTISWQVPESVYRQDPAYSYSTLSRFNREGFSGLSKLNENISTPSLLFGSIVDTILTDGEDEFNKRFLVATYPNISESLSLITRRLHSVFPEATSLTQIDNNSIAKIGAECGYYAKSSYEATRIRNIREYCEDYLKILIEADNKIVVSETDYTDALACINALRTAPATKWYFASNDNLFEPNIHRDYQLKFKNEWNGIPLRCMADLLITDYEHKVIIPVDLKTTGHPEYEFFHSFIKYEYWIQAQLYWYLIRQVMDQSEFFRDFKLLNYRFVVVNRTTLNPLVWEYKDTQAIIDLSYGSQGQIHCRNWRNIVTDLNDYLTTNAIVPKNISLVDSNDIVKWLNSE